MKKVKYLTVFLLLMLLISALSTVSFADSERAVYDRAGLFTPDEVTALEKRADELFSKLEFDIYVVTDKPEHGSYSGVSYWGDDFCDDYGITGNSIILIITANSYNNYDLYTYEKAYSELSDSECNSILDDSDVYYNIKDGSYFDGAMAFIEVTHDEITLSFGELLAIATVLASITTVIFFICVYVSYNKKMRSEKYPLDRYASLDLKEKTDTFAGRFVTRRRIPRSNSGGRSGGRSGGGGGGGHRGGR